MEFSGKEETQLGSAAQESNMKDTRFMQNFFFFFFFFKLDKYRSCWFVHAFSGSVSPSLCYFCVALLMLGTRTCWGLLASLARFLFFFPFCPEHIRLVIWRYFGKEMSNIMTLRKSYSSTFNNNNKKQTKTKHLIDLCSHEIS